jgi:protease PrsW
MDLPASLQGWRLWVFSRSRRRWVIALCGAIILLMGFAGAAIIAHATPDAAESMLESYALELDQLEPTQPKAPRMLAESLHYFFSELEDVAEEADMPTPTVAEYELSGEILSLPIRATIERVIPQPAVRTLYHHYICARLEPLSELGKQGIDHLRTAAAASPALPFANEFHGYIQELAKSLPEALAAFRKEGSTPDARHSRRAAWELAIKVKSIDVVRDLLADPDYFQEMDGWVEHDVGAMLGLPWMQARGLVRSEWGSLRLDLLCSGMLAASLWATVLRRFLRDRPRPWLWMLVPLLLGVLSVLPTLMLVHQQEHVNGIRQADDLIGQATYYLLGVALREEVTKLILFACLLPWLLRRRSELEATLAGALVGLGFAFEENLQYYQDDLSSITGRLLTANFLHLAMSAILGRSLYRLVQRRFYRADEFAFTFIAIVLVHAVYDLSLDLEDLQPALSGSRWIAVVIVALIANYTFDLLNALQAPRRGLISLPAHFVLGTCMLISISMMMQAWNDGTLSGVAMILTGALNSAILMLLFVRKFAGL